jgi:hypothetical protein
MCTEVIVIVIDAIVSDILGIVLNHANSNWEKFKVQKLPNYNKQCMRSMCIIADVLYNQG